MQIVAIELMAKLAADIEAIRDHLSEMDSLTLTALEKRLPKNARAGGAEMVMLLLVFREMEARKTSSHLR